MVPQQALTSVTLADIARIYAAQPGGFISIEYIPIDDIDNMDGSGYGMYNEDGLLNAITLKSGKTWYLANVPVHLKGLTESPRTGDAGLYYEIVAEVFIPFYGNHNHMLLGALPLYRYVCKVKMPTGAILVMGNLQNGCRFEQSYDTTPNFKGIPGARGRFTWQHSAKIPLLVAP